MEAEVADPTVVEEVAEALELAIIMKLLVEVVLLKLPYNWYPELYIQ